ncbi:MAG: hypothetical protein VYE64_05000 [Planctomycetota bacterium]|nr:hypothetical protein [Planctomycetota bacterium]
MANRRMNQRRRRVVLEEVTQSARDASQVGDATMLADTGSSPDVGGKPYSNSAQRRYQKKTTDLIPKRYRAVTLMIMLLVASVCGLNLLSAYSADWRDQLTASQIEAFALSGQGSLARWFVSFLLILSSLASLQLYALRQHRCDDYRGTYRLWGWLAVLFLLGSIQCSVDLLGLIHTAVASLVGTLPGDRLVWLVTAKLLLLSALVVRGLFEVRVSRVALAGGLLAWIGFTTAIVLPIPSVGNRLALELPLYYGNALLIGTSAVFLSVVMYARFVFLHSNGLLAAELVSTPKPEAVERKESRREKKAQRQEMKRQEMKGQEQQRQEQQRQEQQLQEQQRQEQQRQEQQRQEQQRQQQQRETTSQPVQATNPGLETAGKTSATGSKDQSRDLNRQRSGKKKGKKLQASTPLGSRIKKKQSPSHDFSFDLEQDEIEMFHLLEKENLSKSERRRLRKLQKRQNRAA